MPQAAPPACAQQEIAAHTAAGAGAERSEGAAPRDLGPRARVRLSDGKEGRLGREAACELRAARARAPPGRTEEERKGEGRGGGAERRSLTGLPCGSPPTRPARRYLKRPGRAANRKLESARGSAAVLLLGRKPLAQLALRRLGSAGPALPPGVSCQPGSPDLASPATAGLQDHAPQCWFLPRPLPRLVLSQGWRRVEIPKQLLVLIQNLYIDHEAVIQAEQGHTARFKIRRCVHQGCTLSPCLFNQYAEQKIR
ncbi:uncharacterized protein LOC135232139 [Loxodonta africana]|uniref:uncharacterized protein LOC135232139 n=1 Tax=Loxodonta africana TaxID=9785 RepID=UPI0030D3F35E